MSCGINQQQVAEALVKHKGKESSSGVPSNHFHLRLVRSDSYKFGSYGNTRLVLSWLKDPTLTRFSFCKDLREVLQVTHRHRFVHEMGKLMAFVSDFLAKRVDLSL